ncbi:MAG TPA: hypothetical protein VMV48_07645 [Gallionellaceae bacterium]|nr:hypothetical protein [Gallionellaceae bacterium]
MNKILITIQGRTLILYYRVKHDLSPKGTGRTGYIEVFPSDELAKFDLKGLTPEMFCVNIADMVNIRGLFSGQVENERQIPVARWVMNHEEYYLQMMSAPVQNLTHLQIVRLLAPLPGYIQETGDQYIDFEENVVPHRSGEGTTFSGYRLSIATEDIEGNISSCAYYSLDTRTSQGWQGTPPPQADYEAIRTALANKLQTIRDAGVQIAQVYDETDYALANSD